MRRAAGADSRRGSPHAERRPGRAPRAGARAGRVARQRLRAQARIGAEQEPVEWAAGDDRPHRVAGRAGHAEMDVVGRQHASIASRQRSCRPPWPRTTAVSGWRRARTASWSGVENGGVPSWNRIGIPIARPSHTPRPGSCAESLQPGMQLDASHAVLRDAASDLLAGTGIARVDGGEWDKALRGGRDPGCERVVRPRARPQQPFVGEDDGDVHPELVHRGEVVAGPVRGCRRLVDVEVDHVGAFRATPAACAIRSASSRLAIASSIPGRGGRLGDRPRRSARAEARSRPRSCRPAVRAPRGFRRRARP